MLETSNIKPFSLDEYLEISRSLELHASIFFKLWDMGKPIFSDDVPTSAVLLDKENNMLNFAVNPEFWNSLKTAYDKTFVISHECMHVLLKHGTRGHFMTDRMVANATMDIAINHLLVNNFGFSRALLSPELEQKLCWVDTVFTDQAEIPPDNKAFEYYYELLRKMIEDQQQLQQGNGAGSGNGMEAIDDLSGLEEIEKWLQENQDQLGATKEDVEELQGKNTSEQQKPDKSKQNTNNSNTNSSGRGDNGALQWISYPIEKVQTKNKWEKLFKEFNRRTNAEDNNEQWARTNRRFVTLPSDLMLPTENSNNHFKKEKIEAYLFLDVSGSCRNLGPRFLKAARSINLKYFNLHVCAFSTWVEEISLKSNNIPMGSGTKFDCMETFLLKQKNYPKYVMVFTDGDGGYIYPRIPQNWHWFLSEDSRYYIPDKSKTYMLKDFE